MLTAPPFMAATENPHHGSPTVHIARATTFHRISPLPTLIGAVKALLVVSPPPLWSKAVVHVGGHAPVVVRRSHDQVRKTVAVDVTGRSHAEHGYGVLV